MKTSLNKIRKHHPCAEGWAKLLKHLGKSCPDDEDLDLLTILKSNGLNDALWCLRAVDGFDREKRLFAVWCARQVEHLSPDPRVKACNDMAERYANSLCTIHDLNTARRDATDAYADAYAAAAAAAAYAAYAAAAAAAAYAAAVRQKARLAQETEFRRMLQEGYP